MNLKKEVELKSEETRSFLPKALTGAALLSLLFWSSKKRSSQQAELKIAKHAVSRAENQTGRMEKA